MKIEGLCLPSRHLEIWHEKQEAQGSPSLSKPERHAQASVRAYEAKRLAVRELLNWHSATRKRSPWHC